MPIPTSSQKNAHNVSWNDFTGPLLIALTAHLLFFSLTILQGPLLKTATKTEMFFLGAILDPFEAKKLTSEGTLAADVSSILKKPDQKAGLNATSQNKPNFTKGIDAHSKNFFKSAPQVETPAPTLPPVEIRNTSSPEAETPPYRRLRLYQ